jgi:putative resolvase
MEQISYTISEFAAIMGVTPQAVYRWIKIGSLKTVKFPGGWKRIPESEVKRFRGDVTND